MKFEECQVGQRVISTIEVGNNEIKNAVGTIVHVRSRTMIGVSFEYPVMGHNLNGYITKKRPCDNEFGGWWLSASDIELIRSYEDEELFTPFDNLFDNVSKELI